MTKAEERQDCIDEIKCLRAFEKKNRKGFYALELYEDLALEEMKARELGIKDSELESS